MSEIGRKLVVFVISATLACGAWPSTLIGQHALVSGAGSADEAARLESEAESSSSENLGALRFLHLQPDTTEATSYEEEERNLVREITVWVIGAAFVGYFIVKVFLQGETDVPPPKKPGKQIPGTEFSSGALPHSF